MKKILAALLVLALVAPSFAVTITGNDQTAGKLQLRFTVPTGEVLRGMALKLSTTVGTATIADTAAVTNIYATAPGLNTFIDYAFSTPVGYTVGAGHPLANSAAAGVLTVFPAPVFSLSMGVLDQSGAKGGITNVSNVVLCEIQYAITGASATIHVEADTLRGGAVVGDAVIQPTAFDVVMAGAPVGFNLTTSVGTPSGTVTDPGIGTFGPYTGSKTIVAQAAAGYAFVNWTGDAVDNPTSATTAITMNANKAVVANFTLIELISQPTVAKTTAAPAIAGRVNGGRVETFVASGAASNLGHALEYQFTWGDTTTSAWGAATQTKTYTYAAAASYNVTVQARCATHTSIVSVSSTALTETSEAVKSTAAFYATWATFSRPNCWAFSRNCRGDANGAASGGGTNRVWVNATDLGIFSAAYNLKEGPLAAVVVGGIPGICADNNRGASGGGTNRVWVNSTDLGIFAGYYNLKEAGCPVCDATWYSNYWYWTN
jgi:hypothetical protein